MNKIDKTKLCAICFTFLNSHKERLFFINQTGSVVMTMRLLYKQLHARLRLWYRPCETLFTTQR